MGGTVVAGRGAVVVVLGGSEVAGGSGVVVGTVEVAAGTVTRVARAGRGDGPEATVTAPAASATNATVTTAQNHHRPRLRRQARASGAPTWRRS